MDIGVCSSANPSVSSSNDGRTQPSFSAMSWTTGNPLSSNSGSPKFHDSPFRTLAYSLCIVEIRICWVSSKTSAYLLESEFLFWFGYRRFGDERVVLVLRYENWDSSYLLWGEFLVFTFLPPSSYADQTIQFASLARQISVTLLLVSM